MFRVKCFLSLFLFLWSGLSAVSLHIQEGNFDPEKVYSVEQIREDFLLLRTALEEAHAGLYYYSSKEEMDRLFESVFESLDRPQTEPEFYRRIARLTAGINDGHTRILNSRPYDEYLSEKSILIPLNLVFIEDKAYILRNYSEDESFVEGGEILSIDGHPMSEILGKILPFVPSDGQVQTSKYMQLRSTVNFGRMYFLLFGKSSFFRIEYKSPEDGQIKEVRLAGKNAGEINRIFQERYPDAAKTPPPIERGYRGDVAVLTIRTFSSGPYRNAGLTFNSFLEETFQELAEKGTQNLIIDLRNNGGGEDHYGKILCSYLIDKPYFYYKYLEVSKNEVSFTEFTDSPTLNRMLKANTVENERGKFNLRKHPNLGEQKPLQPTFKGRVYVLINGGSFSATGETTSVMHFHKRAIFIGEECGAGYYGNTSGLMPALTLPHTGLRIRIPMFRYVMAVSGYAYPDRGIIPDYPVQRPIEDFLSGKDTELEFILDLIEKKKTADRPF
jgi:hypothetical protein